MTQPKTSNPIINNVEVLEYSVFSEDIYDNGAIITNCHAYLIKNDGNCDVVMNNTTRLKPGGYFQIAPSALNLVTRQKHLIQFDITTVDPLAATTIKHVRIDRIIIQHPCFTFN